MSPAPKKMSVEPADAAALLASNDKLVDERHVTVAWGRDYDDVPPLRGVIYTESRKSRIEVSVDVSPQI